LKPGKNGRDTAKRFRASFIKNIMKKIGLSILATVLAMSVNAQINAPSELNCTEEAVNFRTNFSPGWHFSKPVFNQQRVPAVVPDFTMPGLLLLKAVTSKISEQQTQENPMYSYNLRQRRNPVRPNKPPFTGPFYLKTKNPHNYLISDSLYFRPELISHFR
jgi:hypothetical protein